ncbi:hypothetical protein HBH82_117610 [Parastagonospora nodorum]|nr:hypothetical protein HBH82_117610 [Parastagonospora nodorum]KAH4710409.1 hypothetical protein HBH67_037850 [Parastagonospora nodorum]KAH4807980.1 hypothetical protein HBH63_055160 [Parastagonospora nodorum]KAH5601261.1 hypothetical protein HBI45_137190 [Parastagonospora nodorum]
MKKRKPELEMSRGETETRTLPNNNLGIICSMYTNTTKIPYASPFDSSTPTSPALEPSASSPSFNSSAPRSSKNFSACPLLRFSCIALFFSRIISFLFSICSLRSFLTRSVSCLSFSKFLICSCRSSSSLEKYMNPMSSFCGRARPAVVLLVSVADDLMRLDSVDEKARELELDMSFALERFFGFAPYRWASLDDMA